MWWRTFKNDLKPSRPFDCFSQHVYLTDIPTPTQKQVLNLLKSLYSETGALWKPRSCSSTPTIANRACGLLNNDPKKYSHIIDLSIWRYLRAHFWIELGLRGVNEPVVIDATGVPPSPIVMDDDLIIPHFGFAKDAVCDFAKMVYGEKLPYDGTTSSFPPGFHP